MKPAAAIVLTCLLGALLYAQDAPAPKVHYSALTYATKDHIQAEQGTLELWIRPDVDVTQPAGRFYHFSVFRIARGEKSWGDQGAVSLMWLDRGGLYLMASDGPRGSETKIKNLPFDKDRKLQWKPGQWHHVAMTWNGPEVALYTDGELLGRTEASHPLPIGTPGYIVLGLGDSKVAVDELVVSSVARSAEQIRQRMTEGPTQDEQTLLWDPMENLDPLNGRASSPQSHAAKLVEGKFGQAVQLYQ